MKISHLIVLAMASAPAMAEQVRVPVAQVRGQEGSVALNLGSDQRPEGRIIGSVGLSAEYDSGRILWIDKRTDGSVAVGLGIRASF
jgi:hypothetical protein